MTSSSLAGFLCMADVHYSQFILPKHHYLGSVPRNHTVERMSSPIHSRLFSTRPRRESPVGLSFNNTVSALFTSGCESFTFVVCIVRVRILDCLDVIQMRPCITGRYMCHTSPIKERSINYFGIFPPLATMGDLYCNPLINVAAFCLAELHNDVKMIAEFRALPLLVETVLINTLLCYPFEYHFIS
jgi:hypothetical protein